MFTYLDSTISSLEEVFFPGITICNINNIKSSEFHEIGISHNDSVIETFFKFYVDVNTLATVQCSVQSFCTNLTLFFQGLPPGKELTREEEEIHKELEKHNMGLFLEKVMPRCDNMFLVCSWHGEAVDCKDIVRPVNTDYGRYKCLLHGSINKCTFKELGLTSCNYRPALA